MKLYNRVMNSEFAFQLLEEKEYVFLYSDIHSKENVEKRGKKVKEDLKPSKWFEIQYFSKGVSKEGKIEEGFHVVRSDGTLLEYNSLRKSDMNNFLEQIFFYNRNIVVDFTLMNTRFLGAFCAVLSMFGWDEVYFCYTEPGKYSKNDKNDFELKNSTMGFDQIPSLETVSDSSAECDWVIFLGFEGSRIMRLEEEAPASRRYSLPHMSIPAMRTIWHNVAVKTNSQFFELKLNDQEKIKYVSAINPFETYQRLNEIKSSNLNVRLVISPIGPKPVMLGCIMYVLENENEMILFDNPYQEGSNTVEYGVTHFYDLSQFVHSVENRRFIQEDAIS